MSSQKSMLLAAVIALGFMHNTSEAAGRHYYSNWSYYPQRTYYYVHYYYKPAETYDTYRYHYCIYYPATPSYVYYYNPYTETYWGRYDLKEKGYSMLEEKDRKKNLKDIPDAAFPKPGQMPAIPEAKDGEKMLPPPKVPETAPKNLP